MKRIQTAISIAAVLVMLVLVIVPVQAAPGVRSGKTDGAPGEMIPAGILVHFEEKGYSVVCMRPEWDHVVSFNSRPGSCHFRDTAILK